MKQVDEMTVLRLSDGTLLQRQQDGSYHPIESLTDWNRISQWTDDEIETMASSDPDHPPLDDEFWNSVDRSELDSRVSVELDRDVIDFFRGTGRDVDGRINAVLRDHVAAQMKRTGS